MAETLALRTAKKLVEGFKSEADFPAQHQEAMDCRDCEDFLQLGIETFNWIIRADQMTRQEMLSGHDPLACDEVEDAIRLLCQGWLEPCKRAEKWIAIQHERGFRIENLDRFRHCCVEMQAIVNAWETEAIAEIPDEIARLRDKAIEEHRNGQTAEFV